jgi:hypothetical protein
MINLEDLIQIEKMLRSNDDDFNIALSNLNNLKFNECYYAILLKRLREYETIDCKKYESLNKIIKKSKLDIKKLEHLRYIEIYNIIKNKYLKDEILKTYYMFSLTDMFEKAIKNMELSIKITFNDPFES